MAANFWTSTQHRFWHFSASQLVAFRSELQSQHGAVINQYPIPDRRHLLVFLKEQLLRLSRRLQSRQQCLATTLVYIHRYLLFHPIQTVNPYLLLTTAFYLASKTEESPTHIRVVLGEARHYWAEYIPADVASIGEMEFAIISELRSQLIVWHPYRTLMDLKLPETQGGLELSHEEVGLAWDIINDSYLTDLPLTCAPHEIAVAAIMLAVTYQPATSRSSQTADAGPSLPASRTSTSDTAAGRSRLSIQTTNPSTGVDPATTTTTERSRKLQHFVAHSTFNLTHIIHATQELISLYESWQSYNEQDIRDTLAKSIKTVKTLNV